MADRPIIFSGAMVRAILAGRKSQTRRVLKLQPIPFAVNDKGTLCDVGLMHVGGDRLPRVTLGRVVTMQEVPFAVGDRLWVRETWRTTYGLDWRDDDLDRPLRPSEFDPTTTPIEYLADETCELNGATRSPIFMPRWASRITLEVTEVRVERLQDISDEDVRAEGALRPATNLETGQDGYWSGKAAEARFVLTRREAFAGLWNSIHGKDAWDANPWVAAITFRPVSVPPSGGKALEPLSLHPGDLGLGGGA